jgi:cyanuric acid amidohydrolase
MRVRSVEMISCPMRSPSDVSSVASAIARGAIDPAHLVAIVGKTEGTGLHDDFGRELAHRALCDVLARSLGMVSEAIDERVTIILSGGCSGIIAPHVTLILESVVDRPTPPSDPRLALGTGRTAPIAADEIGRMGQVHKVAEAVREALARSGIAEAEDVHCVMVKAPTLTREMVRNAAEAGGSIVSRDLTAGEYGAMSYSNDASALGVALALGEVSEDRLSDDVIRRDWSVYSNVAITSSGGEISRAEVLLLGNCRDSASDLRIGHSVIRDLIDVGGVKNALRSAGLRFSCCPSAVQQASIVQVFAKLIVPGTDELRGSHVTLLDDHDAHATAKAIGATLVSSITGHPAVFVSGGERNSHQGPPDGSPVAAVVRVGSPGEAAHSQGAAVFAEDGYER